MQPTNGMNIEHQKCQEFVERTCGCRLNNGSPCSSLIPLEQYVCHRSEAAGLTCDQLDIVLMGAVMSVLNTNSETFDKSHKTKSQEQIYSHYLFGSQRVCRRTYQFLLGVGKDRLQAIKANYMENAYMATQRGFLTCDILWGNSKDSEVYHQLCRGPAILLPGRIPGYKRDDLKLLPSSTSKKVKHRMTWNQLTNVFHTASMEAVLWLLCSQRQQGYCI